MEKRTQVLNAIIKKFNYTSYLEIGIGDPPSNFPDIDIPNKTGVDPHAIPKGDSFHKITSDAFFLKNADTYDLIFIDGYHGTEQVFTDIINALACLNPNGTIAVHDVLPHSIGYQRQESKGCGTAWKAFALLRMTRSDLSMDSIRTRHGVGIIRVGGQEMWHEELSYEEMTWEYLEEHKYKLMKIGDPDEFLIADRIAGL